MEKQIDSTTIYDGAIIKVTKEHVLLQDGNTAVRECVYHHGGVCILAIEDDEIILVKQFRYPNRCDTLEIPAGKLELGEDPDKACYREFEEETNRRAKNMRPICCKSVVATAPLMAATVPTFINTGVCTVPCTVVNSALFALPSVFKILYISAPFIFCKTL